MLSYQHAYHAGNHADLLKHFVVFSCIDYLKKKEKPFTFIDTHSGSGLYLLSDERAQKTHENESGVLRLFKNEASFPEELKPFTNFLKPFLKENQYPGSPLVELCNMRKNDVLLLNDLHPQEYKNLEYNAKEYLRAHTGASDAFIMHADGYNTLNAKTPPVTKRGAVLIDPSYETEEDYENVAVNVLKTFRKWSGGVIMVWYPLLGYRMGLIESMIDRIENGVKAVFPNTEVNDFRLKVFDEDAHVETSLENTETPRLFGSGMLVINTPWKLPETMETVIPYLEKVLSAEN